MNILVTGGAGFVGSHVCERLITLGHKVTVIDNLSFGKEEYLPKGTDLIKADILDIEGYFKDLPDIDSIIHLAAQTNVNRSVEEPLFDFRNNALGTATILELARKKGIKDFRLISSAAVYGNTDIVPITEEFPLKPMSMYGASKLTSETLAKMYAEQNGISGAIFRPSNIYGPRQRSDLEGGVASIFTKLALTGEKALIFGDGNQTRDFIFVEDVANFICHDIGAKRGFDILNLSTGKSCSIVDLWRTICDIVGVPSENVSFKKPREGDIYHSTLSNDKLLKSYSDIPVTDLKSGITKTVNYFRTNLL